MRYVAIDFETHLIKAGMVTPRPVCMSTYDGHRGYCLPREECFKVLKQELERSTLIAFNAPFDLGVACAEWPELIPLVFKAYEEGRVSDPSTRQKILDNAAGVLGKKGKYSHKVLAKRLLDIDLEKEDTYRLRYHELEGIPMCDWPKKAIEYSVNDSKVAAQEWWAQHWGMMWEELTEARADWALHLCSINGLRTELEPVLELEEELEDRLEELDNIAYAYKFIRADGSKDTKVIKAAVQKHYPDPDGPPLTPTGQVSMEREVLERCTHKGVRSLGERSGVEKLLGTYIPVLKSGTRIPICPGYDVIKDTFRTSSFKPNVQNLPRKRIRHCFIPREGWVYVFCDYDTLELRTLAQTLLRLFGQSAMADALRAGKDLHILAASHLMEIPYEECLARYHDGDPEVELARQIAKCLNFGLPGGMGVDRFVNHCADNGVTITREKSQYLKGVFLTLYPEMRQYFRWVSDQVRHGPADIEFVGTGYRRGNVTYTALCNGNFQHPAAMGAKNALWMTARECYLGATPLRGSRPVLFLHDEIGMESREDKADAAARRLEQVMIQGMEEYVPDIPITCSSVIMRRWYKGAKPVTQDGKLVPCRPEQKDGKTVWVADL